MTRRLPAAFAATLGRPLVLAPSPPLPRCCHLGRGAGFVVEGRRPLGGGSGGHPLATSSATHPAAGAHGGPRPPPLTMGLHAALCLDVPDGAATRAATRAAHLEWVAAPPPPRSSADGSAAAAAAPISVPFGGPLLGADGRPVGSLLLVEGEALPAVEAALAADPYARAGLFQSVSVRAWRRGMASPPPLPSTLYVVYCVDVAGGKDLRATTRPAHLDWWKASGRAGMIGPFPDGDGAVRWQGGGAVQMNLCEGGEAGWRLAGWALLAPTSAHVWRCATAAVR